MHSPRFIKPTAPGATGSAAYSLLAGVSALMLWREERGVEDDKNTQSDSDQDTGEEGALASSLPLSMILPV